MPEFRVQILCQENDSYNELYKVIGEKEYFARNTYGRGDWYFVCDPLGYCELDHACPEDYIFCVCDASGNELFRDSNGAIKHDFPTLEEATKQAWDAVKDKYSIKKGLNNWLLSYLTPDVFDKYSDELRFCPYDNWVAFWMDEVSKRVIGKFNHIGQECCIYEVVKRHRYCDCVWKEYYAGAAEMDEYDSYIISFGADFANECGPMYSPREAKQIVADTLMEIYTGQKYGFSRVDIYDWGTYERKYGAYEAAELLIGGDYSRKHIEEVIVKERSERSFYTSWSEIKEKFSACQRDYGSIGGRRY